MTTRDAVTQYLQLGLRPIPMWGVDDDGRCLCGGSSCNAGKHAKDDREPWKDGRDYLPHDFAPRDNIAIALGPWRPQQWLVCLDVDGPAPIERYFPGLPETMLQRSPRGWHHFFTVEAFAPLGNWVDCLATKRETGTGVDVRYARGKINVAPSRSAFGSYEWVQRLGEPAPLPPHAFYRIEDSRRRRKLPMLTRWERPGKRP